MKNKVSKSKIGLLLIGILLINGLVQASNIYTAISSGNWNSSSTWGRTPPPLNLSNKDKVVITPGIIVSVSGAITMNGKHSELNVSGTLESDGQASLTIISGTVEGSGIINLDNIAIESNGIFSFIGQSTSRNFVNSQSNLNLTASVAVNDTLLLKGDLTVQPGAALIINDGASIELAGGQLKISGGSFRLPGVYNVTYNTFTATTGVELSGKGLQTVTVDVGKGNLVTLSKDLNTRILNLQSGILVLSDNSLYINEDIIAKEGRIFSNENSDVYIHTAISPVGNIAFADMGNTVRNMNIDIEDGGSVSMGSDVTVQGSIFFTKGHLNTSRYNIQIDPNGSIMGANINSYIITSAGGSLIMNISTAGVTTYPVGTESDYFPASISPNLGSATGEVGVNVSQGIYVKGTNLVVTSSQPLVNATWRFQTDITSGLNYDMELAWQPAAEANGFSHNSDYISDYSAGTWNTAAYVAATEPANGIYSLERKNINTLSLFAVFDSATSPAGLNEITRATTSNKSGENAYGQIESKSIISSTELANDTKNLMVNDKTTVVKR